MLLGTMFSRFSLCVKWFFSKMCRNHRINLFADFSGLLVFCFKSESCLFRSSHLIRRSSVRPSLERQDTHQASIFADTDKQQFPLPHTLSLLHPHTHSLSLSLTFSHSLEHKLFVVLNIRDERVLGCRCKLYWLTEFSQKISTHDYEWIQSYYEKFCDIFDVLNRELLFESLPTCISRLEQS